MAKRSGLRRALLLYVPGRDKAWIGHLLFYFLLASLVAVARGYATGYFDLSMDEPLLGFVIIAIGAVCVRAWAAADEYTSGRQRDRPLMQRWFLLYPPPSGAALVPHLLFYVIVLMFLWILVLDSLDFADEPSLQRLRENWESAVPVFVVLMASCLMMRNWASAYDRVPVQQEKSDEQTAEKPRSVVEAGSISLQAERDLSRPGGNSEPVRTRTFCGP